MGPARLSVLLACVVLVGACGANPNPTPTPTPAFDDERVIDILTAGGVEVFAEPTSTQPVKPVTAPASGIKVLAGQAHQFALEASAHDGLRAADVDEIGVDAGLDANDVPFSFVIASWLKSAQTPAADQARLVMGDADLGTPQQLVFPALVQLLFVADAAAHARPVAAEPFAPIAAVRGVAVDLRPPARLAAGTNFCVDLVAWVDSAFKSLTDALKLSTGNGFLDFFADIWNAALDAARAILQGVLTTVLGGVLAIIQKAITALGVISYVVSFFKKWTVTLAADSPVVSHFAHPGEPDHNFSVTATLDAPAEGDWASDVAKCANAVGNLNLPSPGSGAKRVEWWNEFLGDKPVASMLSADTQTTSAVPATAHAHYVAGREDPIDVNGTPMSGAVRIHAKVYRIDKDQLAALIAAMFGTGPAAKVLTTVFGPQLTKIADKLSYYATAEATLDYSIGYHQGTRANCLNGIWEADIGSVEKLAKHLIGEAADTTAGGSITRVYFASGKFLERHDFILLLHTDNPDGSFIDTRIGYQGYALGEYGLTNSGITYQPLANDPQSNQYSATVATTVNNAVTVAGGAELDLGFETEKRSYSCDGDTLSETWFNGQATMLWHRIGVAPDEPGSLAGAFPTPAVLGGNVIVHIKANGQSYTIMGDADAVCIHRTVGYEQVLTVRAKNAKPDPSSGTTVPDSFDWSMTVREGGDYTVGDGPPTGTVGGAAFIMQGNTTASFSKNLNSGSFSGDNVDVFGGEHISGSYECLSGGGVIPGVPTPTPGPTPTPCANGAVFCGTATALIELNRVAYPTMSNGSCAITQFPASQGGGWAFTLNIGTPNTTPGGPDYFGVVVDIPDPSALDADRTFTDTPTVVGVIGGHVFVVGGVSITLRNGGTAGDFTGRDVNTGELIRGAFQC